MAQYLVLIYDDENVWAGADQATGERVMQGHTAFFEKNGAAIVDGKELQGTGTATSIRPDGPDGFTVTDGPFVETKEALGGFYLVEAADLDEAIAMAKQIPVLAGGLEIRPIMVRG